MHYAMIIFESPADASKRHDPEQQKAYWDGWNGYSQALALAGIMVTGAGLELPALATRLSTRNGKRHVQDGPYAETKEQLGGFYVIDVPNLDTALEWASRCPAAGNGVIELRPTLPPPPQD